MSQDHFLNLQPGTIVNGRYEIVKCLGTGSMGMVYACRHRELAGHMVAMKVLFAEVARDSTAAARFKNEIVASYGVSHPNVVRAYEYFRDGDLIAFTMEYIGGGDLADQINRDEPLTIEEIVRMLIQMCSGVQAIHDAGIIHRDLKPENILITAQGDIKITDFGIARNSAGPKLTEHGGVVGTIDYVSPEYLERGQVDFRSDIYALGVLAYEMITGESPFRGQSVIETMTMRLRTDAEAPHKLRPDCPPALSNVVLKAMARDVERRYQTGAEMLYDLTVVKNEILPSFLASRPRTSGAKPHVTEPGTSPAITSGGRPRGGGASGTIRRSQRQASSLENPSLPGTERDSARSARPLQASPSATAAPNGATSSASTSRPTVRNAGDPHHSATVLIDSNVARKAPASGARNPIPSSSGTQPVVSHSSGDSRPKIPQTPNRSGTQPKTTVSDSGTAHSTTASVSISTGRISPERVKALMKDVQRDSHRSWAGTPSLWIILIVGLLVGLGIIRVFFPEYMYELEHFKAGHGSTYVDK